MDIKSEEVEEKAMVSSYFSFTSVIYGFDFV